MPPRIMRVALARIAALRRSRYLFCLSGGEVTLYPHLKAMLAAIADLFPSGTVVNMMSNGTASARRMRGLLHASPALRRKFIITLHEGAAGMDRFMAQLRQFSPAERRKFFNFKIIVPPGARHWPAMAQALAAIGVTDYSLMPVLDFNTGQLVPGYSQNEINMLVEHSRSRRQWFYFRHLSAAGLAEFNYLEGIVQERFHYGGMYCAAGRQSIFINEYGEVSRGQFCGKMPYTILERNPFEDREFIGPAKCASAHCTCLPFTSLPKWAADRFAPGACAAMASSSRMAKPGEDQS